MNLNLTCSLLLAGAAISLFALPGCSSAGSDALDTTPQATRTIIRINADGSRTMTEVPVARSATPDLVEAGPGPNPPSPGWDGGDLTRDGTCEGSDLWMFDQPNLTGNELCVYNDGQKIEDGIDLSKVVRCVGSGRIRVCIYNWAGAVQSYYSGNQSGAFWGSAGVETFGTYHDVVQADAVVQQSVGVRLDR